MPLTEQDRAILDFERSWWQHAAGPKADAIRSTLGLSPTVYYQRIGALVDHTDAYALDPLLIRRLRRARADRRRTRFEGPLPTRSQR